MAFSFVRLAIPDVVQVETRIFQDNRGFFMERFRESDFASGPIPHIFVQDNHSRSRQGVLRGLHYQKDPHAQGKLVMAIRGEIFDVAVDVRRESRTFGRWVSTTLSDVNGRMLYVPDGFAHGFCVLSEEADIVYKVTAEYAPQSERGVAWDDPDLAIDWPVQDPQLSDNDTHWPRLRDADLDSDSRSAHRRLGRLAAVEFPKGLQSQTKGRRGT